MLLAAFHKEAYPSRNKGCVYHGKVFMSLLNAHDSMGRGTAPRILPCIDVDQTRQELPYCSHGATIEGQ